MRLFWKVYLWSLGLAFGAVAVLATVSGVREAQRLTQLLRQEQRLYAEAASSQVEAGYHEEIWPFELLATIAGNENFVSWHIVDGAGRAILSDCPLEESDDQHSPAIMERVSSDLHEPVLAAGEGPGVETWVVPMRMRTGTVPWTFRLSFPRETVRREVYAEAWNNLLLALAIAVVLMPVALVVTRRTLAPLHSLTVAADALKTGALDVSLPAPTHDEIGQLVTAFDAMVRSIKVRDAEIREKVRALADARDKLEERVRERTADLSKANENLKREIAERQRAEEAIRRSEQRFQEVARAAEEWIWECDAQGLYTYSSHAVKDILGYTPEEVIGRKHFYDFCPPDDREAVKRAAIEVFGRKGVFRGFANLAVHKNGKPIWLMTTGAPILDAGGNLLGYRGTDMDVTERRAAEEALQQANQRLEELATTDELTGLANRRRFLEILQAEVQRAKRRESSLALVMIDVDGFKVINDTHGHAFGDRVLVEFAKTLRGGARACDTAARYGGDEFMILMPETRVEEAVGAVERIRKAFADRTISDGRRSLRVTVSAGVSGREAGGTDTADGLVRLADEALYDAKYSGRDRTLAWSQIRHDQAEETPVTTNQVETLRREVAKLGLQSKEAFVESIRGLVRALEARDPYSRGHSENVTHYVVAIAETLGLEPEDTAVLRRAAMVHDIGKIGVPDSILRKRGALADHERRVMQRHVLTSVEILGEMRFLEREVSVVRHHHERWDGKGYPDRIAGNTIPRGARVLAVADAFDAITSDRVYRPARLLHEAMQVLIEESGRQFDPEIVDALIQWVLATGRQIGREGDLTAGDLLKAPASDAKV